MQKNTILIFSTLGISITGFIIAIILLIKQQNNSTDIASLKKTTFADTTRTGAIESWSGMIVNKSPKDVDGVEYTNWKICDGSTYTTDAGNKITTPDLRGRFVLGHDGQNPLTNRNIGTTGGEETHTLTINEMPSHSHQYNFRPDNTMQHDTPEGNEPEDDVHGQVTENSTETGGDQPHNNMPPFYVLAYIMRIN